MIFAASSGSGSRPSSIRSAAIAIGSRGSDRHGRGDRPNRWLMPLLFLAFSLGVAGTLLGAGVFDTTTVGCC